jgi:hypothetical protein
VGGVGVSYGEGYSTKQELKWMRSVSN